MKALTTLPIINMRPYLTSSNQRTQVAQEIREVCKEIGFFYIKNHGISIDLQRSIFQNKQKFFDRKVEVDGEDTIRLGKNKQVAQ